MASTTTASAAPVGLWSRPPLAWVRLAYLQLLNWAFTRLYRCVRSHYWIWRRLSQRYHPALARLARLNAYLLCAWAKKRVPAYRRFVIEQGRPFKLLSLDSFPET